jgi:hypothetical protein
MPYELKMARGVPNRLDCSVVGADIDFGIYAIPVAQDPLGEFSRVRHRVAGKLGSFAPSISSDTVKGE